jgi:hypothetical protein
MHAHEDVRTLWSFLAHVQVKKTAAMNRYDTASTNRVDNFEKIELNLQSHENESTIDREGRFGDDRATDIHKRMQNLTKSR